TENSSHDLLRQLHQLFPAADNMIYQSNRFCVLGCDHIAREHQLQRFSTADELRKTLSSAVTWNDAEVYFGLTELCVFCSDANMTGQCKFTTSSKCKSIHCSNDGLEAIFHLFEDALSVGSQLHRCLTV